MSGPKIFSTSFRRCRLILKTRKRVLFIVSVSAVLLTALLAQYAGLARLAAAASGKLGGQDTPISPDGLWARIDQTQTSQRQNQLQLQPDNFRSFRLNRDLLKQKLGVAPLESLAGNGGQAEMTLPMPDGSFLRLRIEESPMMEPGLAAKFPEIKTYQGQGIDDKSAYARFDFTPQGFHALVLHANKNGDAVQISPREQGNLDEYLSYATKDAPSPADMKFQCGALEMRDRNNLRADQSSPVALSFGTTLRTYRLAVAATTRWTNTYGGNTAAGAVSAITTVMNQVNAVYRTELSVRMVLVANNDQIVYPTTFSGTYPYSDLQGDNATGTTNGENQTNLDNTIGGGNYDIGHVFGVYQSGQYAGLASVGVVCNGGKGRGSSMFSGGLTSNAFNVMVVTHEMGHQFGATHVFNASCAGNRDGSSSWEPDSGSTIMSYGSNNCQAGSGLQNASDLYFNGGNLNQIINYINGSAGCATTSASGNNPPTVNAGPSFTVPQLTPFALTATGGDPDGDAVTFTWEEQDLGAQSPPNSDDGARPLFRSYTGTTSPTRLFPSLTYILNNANNPPATTPGGFVTGETMPSTNRTMNFQVTARDNRADGAVNTSTTQVTVTTSSGPFQVTQPNTAVAWPVGSSQTITWNVAGTTGAPVSCANVKISLSTDGGNTFSTLIASTPNDGSEAIVTPNAVSNQARIKIESVGNIFFDISDTNFAILPSADLEVLSITGSPDPVVTGSALTYKITVRNNGPNAATNATVSDNLPTGALFTSCSSTGGGICGGGGQNRTVTFPTLAAGATETITLVTEANCSLADGSLINNSTSIASPTFDPNPANNSKSVTVTAMNPPPVIDCPADRDAVAATPGSMTAIVTYPDPNVTDNCPGVTVVCTPPSGSALPLGVTTVNCTATDSGGATASCSFKIKVWDVIIQDDSSHDYILFNSFTGEYKFVHCGVDAFIMAGQGLINREGSITKLRDDTRVISAWFDRALIAPKNTGGATIKRRQPDTSFVIDDRNILNNIPTCY
jgi:uncharacterized repeat protein (TIGR01451 family)